MAIVTYSCTKCKPIDKSILEVYIALKDLDNTASANEDERVAAEEARAAAETARADEFALLHEQAGGDHSVAEGDHTRAEADHATASADHDNAVADRNGYASDHSAAVADHAVAASDHTRAEQDHARADADHTRTLGYGEISERDHARAVEDHEAIFGDHSIFVDDHNQYLADHATAGEDHTASVAATADANEAAALANQKAELVQDRLDTADSDHTRAVSDHNTAASDHTRAASDHTTAQADHTAAASDHSRAASDHSASDTATAAATGAAALATSAAELATEKAALVQDKLDRADTDHTRAESDHTTAVSDHGIAGTDHTTATGDHTTASADHTLAGTDHTTAASDHTTAGSDHTLAASDHTTASADHTQALADHEVMAGYDTRLTAVEGDVTELEAKVSGISYEITKASASGSNRTPVSIPQGTTIKLHFDRSGDSYTAYYKFFNAGGTEFVNTGTAADDVELTLSDTAVSFYTYVPGEHTSPLIVTIEGDGGLQGKIEELSGDVEQAVEAANEAQSKADEVGKNIDGVSAERTFAITQGTALNTTSVFNHCLIDIPANTKFRARVDYPNGTEGDSYYIYFYDGSTLKKNIRIINGDDAIFLADFKITGVAFVINAAQAIASGNVTVSASYGTIPFELEKKADNIIESVNLFNSNDPDNIIGKSINAGGRFVDNPSYFISHPIKIEPGQSLTLNNLPSGTRFCTYYDKDGHYTGADGISVAGVATLTNTEIEALWCRFTGNLSRKDDGYYIVNDGSTSLPYQPYKDTTILRRTNILQTTGESKDDTMSQDAITKELAMAKEGSEQIVSQKIIDIPVKTSEEYAVTAGQALNTTSAHLRFYVDMPSGYIIRVKVNYPQGNRVQTVYFYDAEGNYVNKSYQKNNEWMEFSFDVDYASIGFYITAADAIADGTAQVSIQQYGRFTQLEKAVYTELSAKEKIRLADVLYHWMKGEKFPIGFHGDSTTDGTSTTGWTVDNSHPAQDEVAGGRGKADYVCELTYPKQLQNLLRAELGGDTLRIYNIGYYGASLANNWNQLDAIYSDVYSDVKMVGIVLGINDRGSYNTPADFFAGVKEWLVKYVEYFFAKGIVPFMVTNQVVTQCGFRPGDDAGYSQMNEDYIQTLCNKAKEEVARYYGLEVIDMNNFGRLVFESSAYAYANITEGLHFKDLGHKLEAGFLFSQLVPWVNRTDDAKEIYFGFNCAKSRTNFQVGRYETDVNDKFKFQLNTTQASATDTLLFDAYMFNNSKNGAYTVKYLTPVASGYIVVDGDTANPIQITATEMNLGTWDIGLHHIQVYTGASTTVAFKGFLLESVN